MCAKHNGELYCGMQSNENRINKMRKCPIKKKKQGGLLVTDSFDQRNRESGNRKSRGWLSPKKLWQIKKQNEYIKLIDLCKMSEGVHICPVKKSICW